MSRSGNYSGLYRQDHHIDPDRELIALIPESEMTLTTAEIGKIARTTRKQLGATQADLALASGTGLRFIVDLEPPISAAADPNEEG